MQIVMTGRHTNCEESLRTYIAERLGRLDKHDLRVERVEVEICEEPNARRSEDRVRVQLTWRGRGPVVRSEAAAATAHEASDLALGKLDGRLRRAAGRRRIHHGARTPVSVAAATAEPPSRNGHSPEPSTAWLAEADQSATTAVDGPMVVREKEHTAEPMSLDQALFEMELVGHEFFLFVDSGCGLPSVVYRRRGYDYGVLRLRPQTAGPA